MRATTVYWDAVNVELASTSAQTPAAQAERAPSISAPADRHWDLLMVCIAGYVLSSVGRIQELFSVLQFARPAIVTALVAISLYLADGAPERRARLLRLPATKCLLAVLAWMALSTPGALVRSDAVATTADFAKTVVMYFVIVGAVRGWRDLERVSWVYLLAATIYAAVVVVRFEPAGGTGKDDWRLGHLYYYDANDFATVVVTALPLGLYFVHSSARTIGRLFALVAVALLMIAFVRTGSRGGFIALLAVAAFIVARYSAIPLRWRAGVTVLAAVVLLTTATDKYWDAMGTILSDTDYNRTTDTGRLQIWRRGLGYMSDRPLFGVGPNNFSAAEGMLSSLAQRQQYGIGLKWYAPHNSYVQAGAELGLPGLVLFLLLLGRSFAALRTPANPDAALDDTAAPSPDLTQALTASLLGFVVGAFFLTLAYSEFLYALLAMAVSVQKLNRLRSPAD